MSGAIVKQLRNATSLAVQPVALRGERPDAAPYPLDALGVAMASAARAIMARVQVPDALAAHSVLAAVSLAVQGHAVVRLPTRQVRPCSLFLATVADSGDRKTSADQIALAPIADFERELSKAHVMEKQAHATRFAVWKAAKDAIAKDGKGKDFARIDEEVERLGPPPAEPALPVIVVPPGTTHGIISVLEKGRPSIGLFINEGGSWLGSWGMQDENRTASISAYSEMWDGQPVKTLTKGEGLRYLPDRAFSFHVMFQRIYIDKLFGDVEMREQGFLSRILAAQPKSLAGTRLHDAGAVEPEHVAEDLAAYHEKLSRIIRAPLPTDLEHPNGLEHRKELTFSPEAERLFWQFYNHVETHQGKGGELSDIRGFAGKATEQVGRLAAIIHVFENGLRDLTISHEQVISAVTLLNFYIGEAQRLAHGEASDPNIIAAEALSNWLAEKRPGQEIGLRIIQQGGPRSIRTLKAERLRELCAILVRHDHLTPIQGGATIDGQHCRDAWRVNVGR